MTKTIDLVPFDKEGGTTYEYAAQTPWGLSFNPKEITPGITLHRTEGHGGLELSAARLAAMPAVLRELPTWAGTRWYEEDCDWALVVLAFPQFFPDGHCHAAIRTARNLRYPVDWDAYLTGTRQGRLCAGKAARDQRVNADRFEPCGWGAAGQMQWVHARHRTTGERITVRFPMGPDTLHQCFTLADAEALIRNHGGSVERTPA